MSKLANLDINKFKHKNLFHFFAKFFTKTSKYQQNKALFNIFTTILCNFVYSLLDKYCISCIIYIEQLFQQQTLPKEKKLANSNVFQSSGSHLERPCTDGEKTSPRAETGHWEKRLQDEQHEYLVGIGSDESRRTGQVARFVGSIRSV